jgi:threonine aldolase
MTNFCSDNVTGACPEIMAALARAGEGAAMPYGNDDWTRRVEARFREVFETDCRSFPWRPARRPIRSRSAR